MRTALLTVTLIAAPALAAELTPELVAKIQHDEKKAQEKLDAANRNRKPSEMSSAERKQAIRDGQSASQEILQKHGVDAKDYARYTAKMSKDERKQAEAAQKALVAKEAADKAAAAKKAQEKTTPTVQRGFSNESPVELEAKEGAAPVVEHGLPTED